MVDSLRGGGFGSPSLGFGTRDSGFGQYRIGNDSGDQLAYLEKLSAATAWQNGLISDDAYLAALAKYVRSADKGSTTRVSAENELRDAEFNIGRNRIVTAINAAATTGRKLQLLRQLLGYDRRWLATMNRDNEQYREQKERVRGITEQIRSVRWGRMVERYNRNQVSDEAMQAFAQRMAASARGSTDEQTYRDQARAFGDRIADARLQEAIDAWVDKPSAGRAQQAKELYRARMSTMDPSSPTYKQYADALEQFDERIDQERQARQYAANESRHRAGLMPDAEWLDYLRQRVGEAKPGSVERIRARDAFIEYGFDLAEQSLRNGVADGSREVTDLIDFYSSSLGSMNPDSTRAKTILAQIADLRRSGLEAIDIATTDSPTTPSFGGHLIRPGGRGGPGEAYISQHDGSKFASTNCGMAATAMLLWDVTDGKVRVSGGDLRYYSGDREAGTWTDDMVRAAGVVGVGAREFHDLSYATFRNRINNGKPAVLTGTNSMLPPSLRHGYSGDHSIFVARVEVKDGKTWFWVMDPNARGGYKGEWWPESAIVAFGWQGSFRGSAVFAGKSGNASITPKQDLPPFQAFDTDWEGRSTLGRGGGANRDEAGPRKDWSQGKKRWQATRRAGGEEAVSDFLSAIDAITRNLSPEERGALDAALEERGLADGDSRERRAARLLARNDKDPRLAAIEWFSGQQPERDPAEWAKTDIWYANAVARKLDLEKVEKDTALFPEESEAPPGTPGTGKPEPPPGGELTVGGDDIITLLSPEADRIAKGLLERLGVPASVENVKAVAAWVQAESGEKVQENNPFRLMTAGDEDEAGQFGRNDEGIAKFETLEDGLDAAAKAIRDEAPGIVGALRSDDPETIMRAIGESGWNEDPRYGSAIVQQYNSLPGDTPVIARIGPRPFTAPTSLSELMRTHPDLEELIDVDPADSVQMAWFTSNKERAQRAALDGADTWTYVPPGATEGEGGIEVPFSAQVGKDILRINFDLAVAGLPPVPESQFAAEKAWKEYLTASVDVDMEAAKTYFEVSRRDRDLSLQQGRYDIAFEIELSLARSLNAITGQGPNDTPDIEAISDNPYISDEDKAWVLERMESLEPRSTDPSRKGDYAPQGSPLLALYRDGILKVTFDSQGDVVTAQLPEGEAFTTRTPDGSVDLHTRDTDPRMFDEVTRLMDDGQGGIAQVPIPRYRSPEDSGMVRVVDGFGESYIPVREWDTSFAVFADWDLTGRSRDIDRTKSSLEVATTSWWEDIPLGDSFLGYRDEGLERIRDAVLADPNAEPDEDPRRAARTAPEERILMPRGPHVPGQAGHPPIWSIELYDYKSGDVVTWLSLDRSTWIGYLGDRIGKPPPVLVPANGARLVSDPDDPMAPPVLTVNGKEWTPEMGPQWRYFGWYGTTGATGEDRGMGAPNADYLVRRTTVSLDEQGYDAPASDFTLTNAERYYSGMLTIQEAVDLKVAQTAAAAEAKRLGQPPRPTSAGGFEAFMPTPTPEARKQAQLLMPGGLQAFVASKVNAVVAKVGASQALAQEERARVEAARQAEQQAAAQRRIEVEQARQDRPAPTPKPAPSPTPRGPAPGPAPSPTPPPTSRPSPKPTPKPTPKPPARHYGGYGGPRVDEPYDGGIQRF